MHRLPVLIFLAFCKAASMLEALSASAIAAPLWFRCETPSLVEKWSPLRERWQRLISDKRDPWRGNNASKLYQHIRLHKKDILNECLQLAETYDYNAATYGIGYFMHWMREGKPNMEDFDFCLFGNLLAMYVAAVVGGDDYFRPNILNLVGGGVWYMASESGWPMPAYLDLYRTVHNDWKGDPIDFPSYLEMRTYFAPINEIVGQLEAKVHVFIIATHSSAGQQVESVIASDQVLVQQGGSRYPTYMSKDPLTLALERRIPNDVTAALEGARLSNYDVVFVFGPGLFKFIRDVYPLLPVVSIYGIYPYDAFPVEPAQFLDEFSRASRDAQSAMVTTSVACAAHIYYTAGMLLRVVTPVSAYLPTYVGGLRNSSAASRLVLLIWRCDVFYNLFNGVAFVGWLGLLSIDNNLPIDIERISGACDKSSEGCKAGGLPWSSVVNRDAVLFFPEEFTKIAFWDLYTIGIPMFVPDTDMVAQFICGAPSEVLFHKYHYFYPFFGQLSAKLPNHRSGKYEAWEPFDLAKRCPPKITFWARFADYYNYPHVSIFHSFVDLLTKLLRADLRAISAAMHVESGRKLEAGRKYYLGMIEHFSSSDYTRSPYTGKPRF